MRCPTCKLENPSSARFCSGCGTRLEPCCPTCGAEVLLGARFCSSCGVALAAVASPPPQTHDLQSQFAGLAQAMPTSLRDRLLARPEGENRVLTILFADMTASVGATAAMHPEDAAELVGDVLKAMIDAILRYDGRINNLLGDGVLAFFGTPQAHENDPERAILAALEIRDAVQRLGRNVTAGINLGEVYLGEVGTGEHHEVTAMGPAVNLAARLREKAAPGEILVGEAVYRQTRPAFVFEECPPLALKGFSEPVIAHRAARALPHPEKLRGIEGLRAELIGREAELERLVGCLAEVRRGRGQIVTVVGEPGVGKSRLVAELRQRALAEEDDGGEEATRLLWLEGRCVDVGMAAAYWPFLDALRQFSGWKPEDDDRTRAARLTSGLESLVAEGHLASDRAVEMAPLLAHALSIEFGDERDERLKHATPEQVRAQTFLAFRDLFLARARHQPLVLVLEDLHWSDSLSLDLISLLMESLTLAPLMLVCVYRPEREHKCWHLGSIAARKCPERYAEITLRELTPEQSQRLVHSLLRIEALSESVRAMILERAQGNPFFVEEVVRSLIDAGMVYQEGGTWKAREGIANVVVPETIQSVVLSRVDRLEEDVKHVLQGAAVIGRLFRRRLLALVSQKGSELDRALDELEDRALIYEERAIPEEEYSFQHALTQETVYQNLLRRRRVTFHKQVAEAIELLYQDNLDEFYEQLAYHYGRSGVAEKAVEYLLKAGQKAAARSASVVALGCFRQALEFARGTEQYDVVLTERGRLLVDMFRGEEAVRDYEELLKRARERGDRAREVEALLGLSGACYVVGLDDATGTYARRSREHAEAAYRLARKLGDKRAMARALSAIIRLTGFWPEIDDQAEASAVELRAIAEEIGDEDLIVTSKLSFARRRRRAETAQELEGLIDTFTERNDLVGLNDLYFWLTVVHYYMGKFRRSVECCDAASLVARQLGVPPVQYPTFKGLSLLCLGRYGEAWHAFQAEVADERHPFGATFQQLGYGVYYFEVSAYDRAVEVLGEVAERAARLSRGWLEHFARLFRAQALVRAGRPDVAELNALGEYALHWTGRSAAIRAEWGLIEGDRPEALREAEASVALAGQYSAWPSYVVGQEVRAQALLALGRAAEAVAATDDGLECAEETGYLAAVWRLRATKGRALLALGQTDAGTLELAAAADLIRSLAETIEDDDLRRGYLADPAASSVLQAVGASASGS